MTEMSLDIGNSLCGINQKIVVSRENKNRHTVRNDSGFNIYQYHIDGDVVTGTDGKRCDYIVEVQTKQPRAYLIELKGSDVGAAISQIESTISRFPMLKNYDLYPRIILHKSRTHEVNSSCCRAFKRDYPNTILKTLECEDKV